MVVGGGSRSCFDGAVLTVRALRHGHGRPMAADERTRERTHRRCTGAACRGFTEQLLGAAAGAHSVDQNVFVARDRGATSDKPEAV